MPSWVLVFVTNLPYIEKAMKSIKEARKVGGWQDDIVLLVPHALLIHSELCTFAGEFSVELRELPDRDCSPLLEIWRGHEHHIDYPYVMGRQFIFMKYYVFDTYFRKWDMVFYIDAGATILGSLQRFKEACPPEQCIYAHSDGYPLYEWTLKTQFCLDFFDEETRNTLISTYELNRDYFQTTMFIYDTAILEEDTVERLFAFSKKFQAQRRIDQGSMNLYFNCQRGLWKQIPLRDDEGFLYDFFERGSYNRHDYALLKYPQR